MNRLLDVYTITGGDEGATYCGRGFNMGSGKWVTATGVNIGESRTTRHVLLDADIVVQTSAGLLKPGVLVWAFIVNDPSHPDLTVPWFHGMSGKRVPVMWCGHRPMGAGVFWRIHRGGVVAGDIVTIGVGYE